jgi:serine/threonine protein kinase
MAQILLAAGAAGLVIALVVWMARNDVLIRLAGADPAFIRTVPDRARYTSMGAIVVLTAIAAAASLTTALSLVFPGHGWLRFLPVGALWGMIVFSFDRWIVSSLDYGPLTVGAVEQSPRRQSASKVVHFGVRFVLAALVGVVISEPIVLTVFGPEIRQQLTVQHTADITTQTAQLNAAEAKQATLLQQPVTAAQKALTSATRKADTAHKVYICEITGNCHLSQGQVTGVIGQGPQSRADRAAWQADLREQRKAQAVLDRASAHQRSAAAALRRQTGPKIAGATAKVNADNGLLARERALGTLTAQNPGFALRRVLLWLALMFIDLVPVLLKTFSPPTLYEHLQRSEANRLARNAMIDAWADSDHDSAKKTVTRDRDLTHHRDFTDIVYTQRLALARSEAGLPPLPVAAMAVAGAPGSGGLTGAGGLARDGSTAQAWVIGQRWHIQRPMSDVPNSGRVPFIAIDMYREYLFEVVVKIIAPPPRVAGSQAASQRRHAQMEMSLPQGHLHDNIAEVLDCDVDPEHGYYIVTRRYPATLEQYLADPVNAEALTIGQVLDFASQILAGLRAAWDRGFVHLDLKPANVALASDGTVKLIDFGLAQQYQKANGGNNTTSAARFTMFYAPPEQMERRDAAWISRKADLRALGAVIYRMLTGYPPLLREAQALRLIDPTGRLLADDATAYFDMKRLVSSVEPVPAGEIISYLPPDLDQLLQTWLRIDPQLRSPGNPATMAERVCLESAAVFDRIRASGEGAYPAGPRVTSEPDFTGLMARWQIGNSEPGVAWTGMGWVSPAAASSPDVAGAMLPEGPQPEVSRPDVVQPPGLRSEMTVDEGAGGFRGSPAFLDPVTVAPNGHGGPAGPVGPVGPAVRDDGGPR